MSLLKNPVLKLPVNNSKPKQTQLSLQPSAERYWGYAPKIPMFKLA
ncbi:MAG: hypothetical protein Q4C95_10060 [Planctomycetia bacterium]|nr:hypothetical protein [Planctomycetia bacterium]